MKVIAIKRKYFYRGKDTTFVMDSDLRIRNVRKLRLHSFSECLQREKSAGYTLVATSMYVYRWRQHVRRKFHKLVIKKRSVGLSLWSRRDGWYRSGKVLSFCIDDPSVPLFRALDWLERQLLRNTVLIPGLIRRRRGCLQGEFILGKMSGHGYDER